MFCRYFNEFKKTVSFLRYIAARCNDVVIALRHEVRCIFSAIPFHGCKLFHDTDLNAFNANYVKALLRLLFADPVREFFG